MNNEVDFSPRVGETKDFEQRYRDKFRAILSPLGTFINYDDDNAKLDIGIHPYRDVAEKKLGSNQVWFQLKGIQESTNNVEKNQRSGVSTKDIVYWNSLPFAVYLVNYNEKFDTFFAVSAPDALDRVKASAMSINDFLRNTETVSVPFYDQDTLSNITTNMPKHSSIRTDFPFFRGRPLGHNLDPLRSAIEAQAPYDFYQIVCDILQAHDLRNRQDIDPSNLFEEYDNDGMHVFKATLFSTFEYTLPWATEFGVGPNSDFRLEAKPYHVQGEALVIIKSSPDTKLTLRNDILDTITSLGIKKTLIFENRDEPRMYGFWASIRTVCPFPIGVGGLTFNLLTTTSAYLKHARRLRYTIKNYL